MIENENKNLKISYHIADTLEIADRSGRVMHTAIINRLKKHNVTINMTRTVTMQSSQILTAIGIEPPSSQMGS